MNSSLLVRVKNDIVQRGLIVRGQTIVVGFSGGADSVFLVQVLQSLRDEGYLNLLVAHLNHEWRSTADNDMNYVIAYAQQYNIPCEVGHLSSVVNAIGSYRGSPEEFARRARRYFLKQVADRYGAHRIALAHHSDDQRENFFIRIARGSSVAGLAGMRWLDGYYIRPLLGTAKSDILDYLHTNNIAYCVDETNNDMRYLRNKIRHTILPACVATDKRFGHNLDQIIERIADVNDYIVIESKKQLVLMTVGVVDGDQIRKIDRAMFNKQHKVIKYQLLMELIIEAHAQCVPSQAFFEEIIRFLSSNRGGVHNVTPGLFVLKKKSFFVVTRSVIIS